MYTHSHIDHFGGALGVLSQADIERGVPVIAPEGFLLEAVSENVLAGDAMTRRATYMFGFLTERGPRGHVDSGLGKGSTPGTFGLAPPTDIIVETGTERILDGVRFRFQNTPGAEAPAEMMIYLPDMKALCGAENVSHVLHNVYTLRGAKVRDALEWSNYLDESIRIFGDADVLFSSHHWPTWGNDEVLAFLKKQRDVYKYIHDQSLRLANSGATPSEIAEQIELPQSLDQNFATRGYYGTVSHNSKAVYQHYFGWFDGNPANLNPLPPTQQAERYVLAMGGAAKVTALAKEAYDAGDYRWVATLLNHVVFAEPSNEAAAALLADTYDQLGYQAESGPWRDFYLTGAMELRNGIGESPIDKRGTAAVISAMPTGIFFDALAVRLNGQKAEGEDTIINFVFTDIGETHVVELENAVLHHRQGEPDPNANATISMTRGTWNEIIARTATPQSKIMNGDIGVDGNPLALIQFFGMLDEPSQFFEIVRP
jgi:alkyl sulfatase BDS1-like metallo-beta-lactamase superfamily hydrolase